MGSIPKFTNLVYNSNLGGTTGTKLYRNSLNNKWVVKQALNGGGYDQVVIESIANCIYTVCGISVPNFYLDVGSKALVLQYIDGKSLFDIAHSSSDVYIKSLKAQLSNGFIVDALIANWDVIGLNFDNIIVPSNGKPLVRIDNGGSFYFRAQGGKKDFPSNAVNELKNMRDKSYNAKCASIFGSLTDSDINTQIKEIIVPNYHKILECIPIQELKDTVKGRMDVLIENTVWTNATTFKNTVVESSVPEYVEPVQKALINFFKEGWYENVNTNREGTDDDLIEYLNGELQECEAIITGGFILKAIGAFVDNNSVDVDICVPSKNIERFKRIIEKLFNKSSIIKVINEGDTSRRMNKVLKMKGILSVTKYAKHTASYSEMDIIEVNPSVIPKNVVQNSDLTFCENWYDGANVYVTYPEHVKQKHGFLENRYLNDYHNGNMIIKKRMNKYISRGFKISINNPVTKTPQNITNIIKEELKDMPKMDTIDSLIRSIKTKINDDPAGEINISFRGIKTIFQTSDNIQKLNKTSLTSMETRCVKLYVVSGYIPINTFLYSNNIIYTSLLNPSYSMNGLHAYIKLNYPTLTDNEVNERGWYYIFINLYNAVQKAPKIRERIPFLVYRNVRTEHLKNNGQWYYTNSFLSTSRRRQESFGRIKMVFIVHPMCKYANLDEFNMHEKEILFTPYHRYLFLKKVDNVHRYLIFPPDLTILTIPEKFDEFKAFKESISTIIAPKPTGGRRRSRLNTMSQNNRSLKKLNNTVKNNKTIPRTMNNTVKNNKTMPRTMNNTVKNNKTMPRTMNNTVTPLSPSLNDETDRFSSPIPSFPGKEPTEKEWELINQFNELLDLSESMEKTMNSKK